MRVSLNLWQKYHDGAWKIEIVNEDILPYYSIYFSIGILGSQFLISNLQFLSTVFRSEAGKDKLIAYETTKITNLFKLS